MVVQPTGDNGNYFLSQKRLSYRFEWNEVWSAPIVNFTKHTVQLGGSVASTKEEGQVQASTILIRDSYGTTLRKIDFTGGSPFQHSDIQPAVFAQDHWKATKDLAIDAGVRFEGQDVTSTTRVAPRLGFMWSPHSDPKTIIQGGFGAFYDSVPLQTYALAQYPEQVFTEYGIDGRSSIPAQYRNVTGQSGPDSPWLIHRKGKAGNFAPYTFAGSAEIDQNRFAEAFRAGPLYGKPRQSPTHAHSGPSAARLRLKRYRVVALPPIGVDCQPQAPALPFFVPVLCAKLIDRTA